MVTIPINNISNLIATHLAEYTLLEAYYIFI